MTSQDHCTRDLGGRNGSGCIDSRAKRLRCKVKIFFTSTPRLHKSHGICTEHQVSSTHHMRVTRDTKSSIIIGMLKVQFLRLSVTRLHSFASNTCSSLNLLLCMNHSS